MKFGGPEDPETNYSCSLWWGEKEKQGFGSVEGKWPGFRATSPDFWPQLHLFFTVGP